MNQCSQLHYIFSLFDLKVLMDSKLLSYTLQRCVIPTQDAYNHHSYFMPSLPPSLWSTIHMLYPSKQTWQIQSLHHSGNIKYKGLLHSNSVKIIHRKGKMKETSIIFPSEITDLIPNPGLLQWTTHSLNCSSKKENCSVEDIFPIMPFSNLTLQSQAKKRNTHLFPFYFDFSSKVKRCKSQEWP